MARAVYSQSDIYLLDDPISAVDAKVARRLYQDVITGLLRSKTVLLVTHQVHYLTNCDRVIILNDGKVERQGTPSELSKELRQLMISENEEQEEHKEDQTFVQTIPNRRKLSAASNKEE